MKAGALLLVALIVVGGVTGVLKLRADAADRARARAMLSSALEGLGKSSGVRYRGALPGSAATSVDARVTSSGVALGSMRLGGSRVRALGVDRRRFVQADAAFWSRHGVFQPSLARTYARRWVQIGQRNVPELAALRTPAQLAAWLRSIADSDAARTSHAQVGGAPATRIDLGDGAVYVTRSRPHRVLRITGTERPTGAARKATVLVWPAVANAEAPDDEGADISDLDASDYDDLIDDAKRESRQLDKAVDSQIVFNSVPSFSCATGGLCTASATVSNQVLAPGRATGTVTATMRVTMTARGQTLQCSDQKTMAPNASAVLSCSASFRIPPQRVPIVVPVVGSIHTTASANVNVERVVQSLERDRRAARRRLCRACDPNPPPHERAPRRLSELRKAQLRDLPHGGRVRLHGLDRLLRSRGVSATVTPNTVRHRQALNREGDATTRRVQGTQRRRRGEESDGCERGHLLGRVLGGMGNDPRNLAAMPAIFNRGKGSPLRDLEEMLKDWILEGRTLKIRVYPEYSGRSPVPTSVRYEWETIGKTSPTLSDQTDKTRLKVPRVPGCP